MSRGFERASARMKPAFAAKQARVSKYKRQAVKKSAALQKRVRTALGG